MKPLRPLLLQGAAWAAVLGVMGAVFAAYLSPETVMALATRVWACF